MNQVNLKLNTKNLHDLEGSIWISNDSDILAMFAQVDMGKFCLIDLHAGNRATNPSEDYHEIVDGYTLVCREAKITVEET
jgi:hypothetical protein